MVNIGELSAMHRMRCASSYEAVAVDLLRLLRGDASSPVAQPLLRELGLDGTDAAPLSFLAVRLNNSAVFLYASWRERSTGTPAAPSTLRERAWILCHKSECAPISPPELGQMIGCTGFISAQVAAALVWWPASSRRGSVCYPGNRLRCCKVVLRAVQRGLVWQHAAYDRGLLHMLLRYANGHWEPTSGEAKKEYTGYENLFADIIRALSQECKKEKKDLRKAPSTQERLAFFDELCKDQVLLVPVEIGHAVAHRTQWFMARSVANTWSEKAEVTGRGGSEPDLKETFLKIAERWLGQGGETRAAVPGDAPAIPIVRIGDLELTDRREIEDYLGICSALRVYAESQQEKIPLNIAVFGAPGVGKSTAIKQVVKHLASRPALKNVFGENALTFNLGQFKSLDDLPAAMHLVRNECLSGQTPIVFFDEFDSSLGGQPFGWLKFFLAPMQDGEFYHAGQTYKLGRAIFVFAGGVNRSFEELNGRIRNPGFCEAKGPDFVSRLKAHLNLQGINKPEGADDQWRYILRRAVLLRQIARRRLEIKPEEQDAPLLHPAVARGLLRVERFKHGVRSLAAIIHMCAVRRGHIIGPSDLPSMNQLEMHVDAARLLEIVDKESTARGRLRK